MESIADEKIYWALADDQPGLALKTDSLRDVISYEDSIYRHMVVLTTVERQSVICHDSIYKFGRALMTDQLQIAICHDPIDIFWVALASGWLLDVFYEGPTVPLFCWTTDGMHTVISEDLIDE